MTKRGFSNAEEVFTAHICLVVVGGSTAQNQNDVSMNKVREDDNGIDVDEEEADNDTEDADQEEGKEEDDEDTDKEGGQEDENAEEEEDEDEAVESEGETEDGIILSHNDILDITAPCHRDESVSHVEIHAHQPQALSSLNNNCLLYTSPSPRD